jgi:Ricin-type beta-trefoil lectin domain-like
MKPLLTPLKLFLAIYAAVSLFPTLALAQLLHPNIQYRIRSVLSGKVLDVKGGPAAVANGVRIKLYQWLEGQNQIWYIENQPDGTYVIRSSSSSLVLDVQGGPDAQRNGDRIQQFQFQGTPNQKWRIIPLDPSKSQSAYKIISVQSDKVLDAVGGMQATENGTELQQWDWNNTANQQWFIEPSHNRLDVDALIKEIDELTKPHGDPLILEPVKHFVSGPYRIRSVLSGKVLDVTGGPAAVANGVRIKLYQWLKGQNQIWYIENQPDGTYVIRSSSSSLVLDVQGGPDAQRDGDRIQQFPFQGTPNQKWRIVPLDPNKLESAYKIRYLTR